jgi:HD-GYP domain-containing protein (c-di-GMP phosphodiesterase class II)
LDGKGYPELIYPRSPHRISQIIRLCDAYDAMRTKRTYQDALSTEEIIRVMEEGAGVEFAADLVKSFVRLLSEWNSRIVRADAGEAHR